MKTINKLALAIFLFSVFMVSAQPPSPEGGNANKGVGPGAPDSPVDMYVYLLAAIAIVLILFFGKKYMLKKI